MRFLRTENLRRSLASLKASALFLALSIFGGSAFAPPNFPILQTPKEKVEFLIGVQEYVPTLFSYNDGQGANHFSVIDSQIALAQELAKLPAYDQLLSKRTPDFDIEIGPKNRTVQKSLDPEAVEKFKYTLKTTLARLPQQATLQDAVKQQLAEITQQAGTGSDSGMLNGLIQALPKDRQKAVFGMLPEEKLTVLRRELPDELISNGFKATNFGIQEPALSKDTAIALYEQKVSAAKQAAELISAQAALQSRQNQTVHNLRQQLDSLGSNDLTFATDKNAVKTRLKTMEAPKHFVAQAEDSFKNLIAADNAGNATESTASGGAGSLKLVEVPAWVGGFRGCFGNDCSTRYSSGYSLGPMERIFVVYGGDGDPKGYVHAQVVEAGEKKTLFAHTITGPKMSARDTHQILQALYDNRKSFGVEQIGLDVPNNGKIGSANVQQVIATQNNGKTGIPIIHLDKDIRTFIDNKAGANYDKMASNTQTFLYEPKAEDRVNQNVTVRPKPTATYRRKEPSQADAMMLAMAFQLAQKSSDFTQTLNAMGISSAEYQQFQQVFTNSRQLPLADHLASLKQTLQARGAADPEEFLKRNSQHLWEGWLNAPDAFDGPHAKQAIEYAVESMQNNRNLAPLQNGFRRNPAAFAENARFRNQLTKQMATLNHDDYRWFKNSYTPDDPNHLVEKQMAAMLLSDENEVNASAHRKLQYVPNFHTPEEYQNGRQLDKVAPFVDELFRLLENDKFRASLHPEADAGVNDKVISALARLHAISPRVTRNYTHGIQHPNYFTDQPAGLSLIEEKLQQWVNQDGSRKIWGTAALPKIRNQQFDGPTLAYLTEALGTSSLSDKRFILAALRSDNTAFSELQQNFERYDLETRLELVPLLYQHKLREMFQDPEPAVRARTLDVLTHNNALTLLSNVGVSLPELVTDQSPILRSAALRALRKALETKSVPIEEKGALAFLELLALERDPGVRAEIAPLLSMVPKLTSPRAQSEVLNHLEHGNDEVAREAANWLGRSSVESEEILEGVLRLLRSERSQDRSRVIPAIGKELLGRYRVQKELTNLMGRNNRTETHGAAKKLLEAESLAPISEESLSRALTSNDVELRAIVEKIATFPQTEVSILMRILKSSPTPNTRAAAAERLLKVAPKRPEVHVALAEALEDRDSTVRASAIKALIQAEWVHPSIRRQSIAAIGDPDPAVRLAALEGLANMKRIPNDLQDVLARGIANDSGPGETTKRVLQILQNAPIVSERVWEALRAALPNFDKAQWAYIIREEEKLKGWSIAREAFYAHLTANPGGVINQDYMAEKLLAQPNLQPETEAALWRACIINQQVIGRLPAYFAKNPPHHPKSQEGLADALLYAPYKTNILQNAQWGFFGKRVQRALVAGLADSNQQHRLLSLQAIDRLESPLPTTIKAARNYIVNSPDIPEEQKAGKLEHFQRKTGCSGITRELAGN